MSRTRTRVPDRQDGGRFQVISYFITAKHSMVETEFVTHPAYLTSLRGNSGNTRLAKRIA
jgi:hypothetical protein